MASPVSILFAAMTRTRRSIPTTKLLPGNCGMLAPRWLVSSFCGKPDGLFETICLYQVSQLTTKQLHAVIGIGQTMLYGAAYYHEYQPYERLVEDIQLMQQAGLTVVRLGESTWASWEPQDGVFEFAWMDRVIDALHKAEIKVILGTPTYAIPTWMHRKHPDLMAQYDHGKRAYYGARQNM